MNSEILKTCRNTYIKTELEFDEILRRLGNYNLPFDDVDCIKILKIDDGYSIEFCSHLYNPDESFKATNQLLDVLEID